MSRVWWSFLGLIDYGKGLDLQLRLRERLRGDSLVGVLLLLEHPKTITLGYSLRGDEGRAELCADQETLQREGFSVLQVDRGGKATYHGPGQLVGYPILDLRRLRLGTKRYVGRLEDFLIKSLAALGIEAGRDLRYPGVWVGQDKIAALGVHIEEKITTHGFALNLDPDLENFKYIIPCGIKDRGVTSIRAVLGQTPETGQVIDVLVRIFGEEFQTEMIPIPAEQLLRMNEQGVA